MNKNARTWNATYLILGLVMIVAIGLGINSFLIVGDVDSKDKDLAMQVTNSLSDWLLENLDDRGVPGAAWAVLTDDSTVSERTWGFVDLNRTQPIKEDTIFCIRSVSKSISALAVLMAVQEGLVDLDTPISTYIPDFKVNSLFDEDPGDLITLRNMLSHWASFAHDPPHGIDLTSPNYFEDYIHHIYETWLRFPVGYRHQYSNYGYDLAGYILEQRSGMSLPEYVRQKVFLPLGMTDSTMDLAEAERRTNRAVGHEGQAEQPVKFPEIASGGVYSSVRDMGRYVAFHLNNGFVNGHRILREDLMAQYHTVQYASDRQETGYTLGLIREPVGRTFSLYHEGGGRGFAAHLIIYPELDIGAVLLTNREYHGLTGFPGREVMNSPIREALPKKASPNDYPDSYVPVESSDPRVQELLGRYGDSPGVTFQMVDGQLYLDFGGERRYTLVMHDDNGQLVGPYDRFMEVRFLPPYGDRRGSMMNVSRYVANHNTHYWDFNDSPDNEFGSNKPEWRKYVGSYRLFWEDDPESTVTVEIRNGHLYFRDGKCVEKEPGLFFYYDGSVLDFRHDPPMFAYQSMTETGDK